MSYNTYKPAYPSRTLWFTPVILVGSVLLIFLAFRVVLVRYFFIYLLCVFVLCLECKVLPVSLYCTFLIAPSIFSDGFFFKLCGNFFIPFNIKLQYRIIHGT
jgi:hypothetical protein